MQSSRVGVRAESSASASVSPSIERVGQSEAARAFDDLIDHGPLHVAFQPIVDIARAQIVGHEILGRLGPTCAPVHKGRGPAALLHAAHACGRLLRLDRRWRSLAVEAIGKRRDDTTLYFLNVDPRVVDDPDYTAGFTSALVARHGLDPRRFVLELTEATSVDSASIERVLRAYKEHGFAIALDDFGAPRQSLALLLRVRPDYLKVDRDVVHGLDTDPMRQHVLTTLVDFAERAGIELIVEGVETEAELRAVRDAGGRLVQGYLLGVPSLEPASIPPRAAIALRVAHGRGAGRRARAVEDALVPLAQFVEAVATTSALEPALQHVTAFAAELLGVERVTVRLLDESRSRLLVAARTGSSLHASAHVDFAVGEGLVGWVVANRKPLRVARASEDPRFAPKPGMTSHMGSFLGVPLLDEHGCIGVLATTAQEPLAFSLDDERRLRLVASIVSPRLQVARLHRLVVTDPLTCVWNRRALDDLLPPASPGAASVAAVDIDLFKSINDRLGHAVGDRVLCDVAGALGSALRETDHVVRVGGDEFLLVLRGAALEQAAGIADRARAAVRATQFDGATITVSIGVAASRPGETRDALLARADASLYCAKAGGRDRVEVDAA